MFLISAETDRKDVTDSVRGVESGTAQPESTMGRRRFSRRSRFTDGQGTPRLARQVAATLGQLINHFYQLNGAGAYGIATSPFQGVGSQRPQFFFGARTTYTQTI